MKRATLGCALVLATLAAGTGCGTLPSTNALATQPGLAPKGPPRLSALLDQPAPPPATPSGGFNVTQDNLIGRVTTGDRTDVSVQQINRFATYVLDDPLELLKHFVEVSDQLVWDRDTHAFYVGQGLWTTSGTHGDGAHVSYRQLNNLIIIVDPHARVYQGTIDQANLLGTVTTGSDSQVDLLQINNVSVIHSGEDGLDADDYVDTLKLALDGVTLRSDDPLTTAMVTQVHDWIIYIDYLGLPHLYRWQAPVGKNGMAAFRPDR